MLQSRRQGGDWRSIPESGTVTSLEGQGSRSHVQARAGFENLKAILVKCLTCLTEKLQLTTSELSAPHLLIANLQMEKATPNTETEPGHNLYCKHSSLCYGTLVPVVRHNMGLCATLERRTSGRTSTNRYYL